MSAIAPISPPSTADSGFAVEQLAALCKASGDVRRLQILRVLRQDSFGVLELCSLFDLRQPAMSHHLKVLTSAGLICSRREGNSMYYRRAPLGQPAALTRLQQRLFDTVDQLPLSAGLEHGLARLQRERVQSSEQFFRQNADRFRRQQDLIASYEQYADTVAALLRDATFGERRLALEVGPGDGRFLAQLAPAFQRVVALDNSAEMLASARSLARQQGLDNIEFVLGDTGHPRLAKLSADCIVVNMVLHHTASPAAIFHDLAAALAAGGRLLITDLCQHHQAWARESCGDLWLGFDPDDLRDWAAAAGLEEVAAVYLAQRNGFQVQVRLFGHRPGNFPGNTTK